MKKMVIAFAVLMSLAFACGALAESSVKVFNGYELHVGEQARIDLDYDGKNEYISWTESYDEEAYLSEIKISVQTADGDVAEWVEYLRYATVYISNIDSDNRCEIFITGDQMSADFITYCFHYSDGKLTRLMFADAMRGENTGGYYDYGYGIVTDISQNAVTLNGTQDVLGTYFASRVYGISNERFELVDDGLWRFEVNLDSPEIWDYQALVPVVDIPATFTDGSQGTIAAGEKLIITASDKVSVVHFILEDGRQGYFPIQPDILNWGSLVNGMNEEQVFEYVPYAD